VKTALNKYLKHDQEIQIMEQVEGGDLIVNRGNESKPKESSYRDLNAADDYEMAIKLCQANIDQLVKSNGKSQPQIIDKPTSPESSVTTPTTYSQFIFVSNLSSPPSLLLLPLMFNDSSRSLFTSLIPNTS